MRLITTAVGINIPNFFNILMPPITNPSPIVFRAHAGSKSNDFALGLIIFQCLAKNQM